MLELMTDATLDLAASDARHGWGGFETLRVQGGSARWLERHLARLTACCAFLGMEPPPPAAAVTAFLARATDLPRRDHGTLRLIAVDGRLIARVEPAPGPLVAARACVSTQVTRGSASPLNGFKSLSHAGNRLLQREAEARGCFEALALNEHGRLTDGGRTTLLVRRGGDWLTPPVADGALPGVARGVLLEAGLVAEAALAPADLEAAEGAAVVNALRGVVPLEEVEGLLRRPPQAAALAPLVAALA